MACCEGVSTPFFQVPKDQKFIVGKEVIGDPAREPYIGRALAVSALTGDVVFCNVDPRLAFGHDQGEFQPPLDVNSLQPLI